MKEGRISFQDEASGESVTLGGGAAVKIPAWVPSYPGSKPEGTFSAQGGEGRGRHVRVQDRRRPQEGARLVSAVAQGGGFQESIANASGDTGGIITAEDSSKRSVMVTTGGEGGETGVQVTYGQK